MAPASTGSEVNMGEIKPVEIICAICGKDTLLVRKPKYDGFTKIGESLICGSCGHEYLTEDQVPFKGRKAVKVFTEADRSKKVDVFEENEADKLCRHCASYIVNPFKQWCSMHKKEVEATDTCNRFVRRKEPEAPPPAAAPKKPIL